MTRLRIVLSVFALAATLTACDPGAPDLSDDDPVEANGIGTSPSDPLASCDSGGCTYASGARAAHVFPCGLWWSPTSVALADARHASAPLDPDMAQIALPDGLSCSAMIAAAPAVVASQGGAAVVYYVIAP